MADSDPAKVRYLREFYSTSEIRDFWKALGDTGRDFAANPIQITSHSQDGESSSGIRVSSAAEAATWFASAERAYREAQAADDDDPAPGVPADQLSRGTDWSQKQVRA